MNKRRWVFVTAPFIVFTIYTYLMSSSFPAAPETMRCLVSVFLFAIALLFIIQRAYKDDNYFIPTIALVLVANFVVIFSVESTRFDDLDGIAPLLRFLLERPQSILYFGLLLMALAPPILWNGSFTGYFSRVDYPAEVWQSREFVLVNKYISYFWGAVFSLCFVAQFSPILFVRLLAPIAVVLTFGAWGTKRLIAFLT